MIPIDKPRILMIIYARCLLNERKLCLSRLLSMSVCFNRVRLIRFIKVRYLRIFLIDEIKSRLLQRILKQLEISCCNTALPYLRSFCDVHHFLHYHNYNSITLFLKRFLSLYRIETPIPFQKFSVSLSINCICI